MAKKGSTVEADARARASHKLADGAPIMDKALLLRCAEEIDRLKAALGEIVAEAQVRGGIWARKRADDALDE